MKSRRRAQTWQELKPGARRVARGFGPYLRAHKATLAVSLLALLAATAIRLLEPWPLKLVIDRVLVSGPSAGASGIAVVDGLSSDMLLLLAALGLVAVIGLRALAAYVSTIGFALVGSRVLTEVRHDVYRHLQRLPVAFHDKARTGDLTMRLMSDVGLMKEATVTALLPLLGNALMLAAMLVIMLAMDWRLALLAALPLPLLWLTTLKIGRRIQDVSRAERAREGAMSASAAESIAAMKTVQALAIEAYLARLFTGRSAKSMKDGVRAKRLAAGLERSVDLLVGISLALVLYYGAKLVLQGALTPGDLLVFFTYLKNAFRPIRDLAKYSGRIAKATAAGERVLDLLEEEVTIADRPQAVEAPALTGAIRFERVRFAYPRSKRPVLDDADLTVRPGEYVALVGPSGIGKSTVISLLLRLYEPDAGRILVDGCDIQDVTLRSLRRQLGLVPQDSPIFAGTLAENIALGDADPDPVRIEAAAKLANAHDFIAAMPEGYATVVGERGGDLSGGQRQRIAVARVAYRQCPILLLDEPTAGLDPDNVALIATAIDRLAEGRTTLLITHDHGVAARADRILTLEDGRLHELGAPTTSWRPLDAIAS